MDIVTVKGTSVASAIVGAQTLVDDVEDATVPTVNTLVSKMISTIHNAFCLAQLFHTPERFVLTFIFGLPNL